jgi:hypothetical protein
VSIYDSISEAIRTHAAQTQQAQQAQAQAAPDAGADLLGGVFSATASLGDIDVEQVLQDIERQKGADLNWRTSIVDLMKLLDLDSSLANRAELAGELGYTGEKNGSAEMNIWLHRRVMEELENNGGRVPDSLKQ